MDLDSDKLGKISGQPSGQTISKNGRHRIFTKDMGFLRALIYIVLLCLIVETAALIYGGAFESELDVSLVNSEAFFNLPRARLYIEPQTAKYKVGDEFGVNIYVDTGKNNVVVASALISYNKKAFKVLNVNLEGMAFEFVAEKEILMNEGKVIITVGKPTPGVKLTDAKIGTVRFKALEAISPQAEDISFDFTSKSSRFSTVILDDKMGTNILSETKGAFIHVE